MKYAVIFEDNEHADPDIRKRHMAAHLAFLDSNGATIEAAGPLANTDGSVSGGLWLVEADDADTIERLVHADPFWPTGLRQSVSIMAWTRVYADGERLIAI